MNFWISFLLMEEFELISPLPNTIPHLYLFLPSKPNILDELERGADGKKSENRFTHTTLVTPAVGV